MLLSNGLVGRDQESWATRRPRKNVCIALCLRASFLFSRTSVQLFQSVLTRCERSSLLFLNFFLASFLAFLSFFLLYCLRTENKPRET